MSDQELTRPPNPSSGRGQATWQVTKKYIVVAHFSIYPLLFLSEQKHFTDELNKHDINFEETHWYKRMNPKLSSYLRSRILVYV